MHIKKGDIVEVIAGNDRGVRGEVIRVIPRDNRVVVKGVNMVKKHQKPRQGGRSQVQGGIIEFEAPIHVSNVMLVDPESDRPTRVGVREDENGQKVRFAKRSGKIIE
jgi:large subunit ribosomal protein L24